MIKDKSKFCQNCQEIIEARIRYLENLNKEALKITGTVSTIVYRNQIIDQLNLLLNIQKAGEKNCLKW